MTAEELPNKDAWESKTSNQKNQEFTPSEMSDMELKFISWRDNLKGSWSDQVEYFNLAKSYQDFASHVLQEYKKELVEEVISALEENRMDVAALVVKQYFKN